MRFVSKWSYACAKHLANVLNENHQKRAVYYLGFFIVIGEVVKAVIMLAVASLFGVLIPTLLIVFVFGSLRMIAGGYHMDTYGKCLFVSSGFFIISALVAQYTYTYWNIGSIFFIITVTFIIGLYVLIRYAPKDTPNKPITKPQEKLKFKRLSIVYLFVWLGISIITAILNMKMYILAMCFGVLLELLAISPTGHKFFDMVKNILEKKKVRY